MSMHNGMHDNDGDVNPYTVFSDVSITLILVFVFVVSSLTLLGQVGWENVQYKDAQDQMREAIKAALQPDQRPTEHWGRNDPPGVQRWVFPNHVLFIPETTELSLEGQRILDVFAQVLRDNPAWRRIRIEGHNRPTQDGEEDDWELSTARSAVVARVFTDLGQIPPWCLAVSGRAGQNPVNQNNRDDPANQRVEILLEYSMGQPCLQDMLN